MMMLSTDILSQLHYVTSLKPFANQVGGHASMFKIGDKLCKPLIENEREFYEIVDIRLKNFKEFIPKYLGLIEVVLKPHLVEGVDSNAGIPVDVVKIDISDSLASESTNLSILHNSASAEAFPESDICAEASESRRKEISSPWSIQCFHEYKKKLDSLQGSTSGIQRYILIEDLTCKYRSPCVLDLKMGVRHYGVTASEKKRQSQMRKSASTTSASLGVRACGMQVYNVPGGCFFYHDKYLGRKLNEHNFKSEMRHFLDNGIRIRYEVLPKIIEKLNKLYDCIEKAHGFRFYSGSLLLIYEGETKNLDPNTENPSSFSEDEFILADVKMIDFANTFIPTEASNSLDDTDISEPDTGYLFGLKSLVIILTDILQSSKIHQDSPVES
eukprot:Sdes_comp15830_c0_seq1m4912